MKKLWIADWLSNSQEQDKAVRLRCRCGLHKWKWDWRRLGKVCIYCKKRKGL
jgi:hypothetical protein